MADSAPQIASLKEFYPYYLGEHRNGVCRLLHFIGTWVGLSLLIYGVAVGPIWLAACAPVPGYAFAWVGHFVFENNRPATFQYPLWSFTCDWIMWSEILVGRVPLLGELPQGVIDARAATP